MTKPVAATYRSAFTSLPALSALRQFSYSWYLCARKTHLRAFPSLRGFTNVAFPRQTHGQTPNASTATVRVFGTFSTLRAPRLEQSA